MKEIVHMSLGDNVGKILLDIAQENIKKGDIKKAFETYTRSLPGFTKEHVMMVLKNQMVLVTGKDRVSMNLVDYPEILSANKSNLYDWDLIIKNQFDDMHQTVCAIWDRVNTLARLHVDAYDYSIIDSNADSALRNIAAKLLANKPFSDRLSNGENLWEDLEDDVYNDSADPEEKILFHLVDYVNLVRTLHKEYMSLSDIYKFLMDNGLVTRRQMDDSFMENALYILKKFMDTSTGYMHPLCNKEIHDLKQKIQGDIQSTYFGELYLREGILPKNILDNYDAGYLAPDGTFYGAIGETKDLLHVQISDQLFEKKFNRVPGEDPEITLMHMGFMKIHHNDIYGSYRFKKDSSDSDTRQLYCPTQEQIKQIASYVNKFYGGEFFTEPETFGSRFNNTPVKVSRLVQADEIQLHQMFEL
jgi:hypothetical protein